MNEYRFGLYWLKLRIVAEKCNLLEHCSNDNFDVVSGIYSEFYQSSHIFIVIYVF